jgi:O-antigen ligase
VAPYLIVGDIFVVVALNLAFGMFRFGPSILMAVGALGVGCALIAPVQHARRIYLNLPLLALCGWLLASFLWAVDPARFRVDFLELVSLTSGAVVVGSLLPVNRLVRTILVAFAAGIAIQYCALVLNPSEATTSTAGETEDVVRGWDGTFDHKNGLALFAIFAFVSFLTLARPSRARTTVLCACVPLVIGSQSSTGMSCFVIVVLGAGWLNLFLRQREHFSGAYLALSALVFAALLGLVTAILPAIVNLYGKDLTFSGRTNIWSALLPAIHDRPLKGYGMGGVFFDHTTEPTVSIDRRAGFVAFHAHNSMLQLTLEAGLIGLGLYLTYFWSMVIAAWQSLNVRTDVAKMMLLLAVMQLVFGLSEVALYGGWIFVLVLLRGMLATANRDADDRPDSPLPRRRTELFARTA